MPQALPFIYLAVAAIGTGVAIKGQQEAAAQENANRQFAADQAAADANAKIGEAQVEAERIRKAAKKQQSAAIAAAAASGVDVNSTSAVRIDQEIGNNAEQDAYLTLVGGKDYAARLNQQGQADRIAGRSAVRAGNYQSAASLIGFAGQATNYGNGWKKAGPGP
jgi:hypothetical protein